MLVETIRNTPINFSIACHSWDVINSVYELYQIVIRFFGRFLNQIRNLSSNSAIAGWSGKKFHAHKRASERAHTHIFAVGTF